MLERFDKKYPIDEVLDFVNENFDNRNRNKRVDFDGHLMKPKSTRYSLFIKKGVQCVACGIEGQYFIKERHQSHKPKLYNPNANYHFNLYGIDEFGEEVLLTKDHVIPKSRGGSDSVENMIPMCTKCNCEKGHTLPKKWQEEHPEAQQLPKGKKRR